MSDVIVTIENRPIEVVIEQDGMAVAIVELQSPPIINAVSIGIQGPPGPPGIGAGTQYNQMSLSDTWTINHNLGYLPSVTAFSVGGVEITGSVVHPTINQTIIQFNTPVAGSARLA